MPSPFPGMDPFLEDPTIFPDLHDRFITYLAEALHAKLPHPYYTAMRARIWIETAARIIDPDIDVLRGRRRRSNKPASGGVAVAELPAKPVVVEVEDDEQRESYLEILKREDGKERLVTAIELLSPSNKTPRDLGRKKYQKKQAEVLHSKAHLIEIDLLRAGKHTTAVPLDRALLHTGGFDYHVCVHRWNKPRRFFVYPIGLRERLPIIEVPLLKADKDVTVDLQAVLDRCYAVGSYELRAAYRENRPKTPLCPPDAAWATQLLQANKLLRHA